MLAADLALALDPVALAGRLGLDPDPWQRKVLRSTSNKLLLNCSRQSGKSTVAAVVALHVALYEAGSLVLLVSPSLRQSQELFRKLAEVQRVLAEVPEPQAESALRLDFANGSRVVSLPGKEGTIRGYSGVDLLVLDEASRVPDELYYSVRPMLAVSGGRLLALSTPAGKRGWWYDAWTNGGDAWERYAVPATDCPRISPAFLAEERRSLPEAWFSQEYLCQFREIEGAVFSTESIHAALTDDVQPLFDGGELWAS